MARPMILMQEALLKELYDKYAQGVPVLKLIRQYKLDAKITAPTLSKLLSYMKAMHQADSNISIIIYNSLFPNWLVTNTKLINSSPNNWFYSGQMPLGKWVIRDNES